MACCCMVSVRQVVYRMQVPSWSFVIDAIVAFPLIQAPFQVIQLTESVRHDADLDQRSATPIPAARRPAILTSHLI